MYYDKYNECLDSFSTITIYKATLINLVFDKIIYTAKQLKITFVTLFTTCNVVV